MCVFFLCVFRAMVKTRRRSRDRIGGEEKRMCFHLLARAAVGGTILLFGGHGVHNLQKRKFGVDQGNVVGGSMGISRFEGKSGSILVARAALCSIRTEDGRILASGFLASQLALGFRAQSRGLAFPCTLGLLTERRTVGLRGGASCSADSGSADSLASRAVLLLAHILRASHGADRFFTMHLALGTFCRFAVHLALGSCTDWMALSRADGIITKPLTLGVALGSGSNGHEGNNEEK
jgi:hypothetical protein